MAAVPLETCSKDYESIYHSLGRAKSLLENLNSETSEKLPSLEQKSRLLKNAITKHYEPLASDYIETCADNMLQFYLANLQDISQILQRAIILKQQAVDASSSELQRMRQRIEQMEEQKKQEISAKHANTLELLHTERNSLQHNLALVESEIENMKVELSEVTELLNNETCNYDCETLLSHRNSLQKEIDLRQQDLQDLKEQSLVRKTQLNEYSSTLDSQQCGPNWEAEKELVAKTNVRLREQVERMQNVILKRFPSEEAELRRLALAELQNEMALCSLQHSILENSANQQFSECKKLLHALGTLIRNCSPNTKTASAIIKILDIFFHNNEIAERQSFTCDQLTGDLERDEAKEAISEMVRLGLLQEQETGLFALAANHLNILESCQQNCFE